MENSRTAIIVLSCDKYADVWPIFFDTFFKQWPDCPFPVYLTSNIRTYNHPRVTTLTADVDMDWSTCMRASLAKLSADQLFFMIEDSFITQPVKTEHIQRLTNEFSEKNISFLKLFTLHGLAPMSEAGLQRIPEEYLYRATLVASLWKKDVFLNLLRTGETAQQFELAGSKRSAAYPDFYYLPQPQFSFLHGIKKGKWYPQAVTELKKMGYTPDVTARPVLPRSQSFRDVLRKVQNRLRRLL